MLWLVHFFNRRKMDGNCFEGFHIWPQTKIWDRKKNDGFFFTIIIFYYLSVSISRFFKKTCLKFLSKRKTIVIFFRSDSTRLIEINVWNLVVKHPSKFSSTYNVFVKLLMWLRTSESHVNSIGQFLWHSIHNT